MFSNGRPSWRHPRVVLTLALVFLAGGVIGVLGARSYIHYQAHSNELSYERMHSELNLSDDQSRQLKMILDDMVAYNRELEQQIQSYRATGKDKIMAVLTPDQRKKFEKMCADARGTLISSR